MPMIYRWHGYGVDAMVVARPKLRKQLFVSARSTRRRRLFSLRDNNNTNGFQFSITYL